VEPHIYQLEQRHVDSIMCLGGATYLPVRAKTC
jgi:hypothetical protein